MQLESLVANGYLLADKYGNLSIVLVKDYHSVGVDASYASLAATISTVVLACLIVVCAWQSWRLLQHVSPPDDLEVIVRGFAATVLILVVFGKVLSPQYMMWLLPVALVIRGRSGWVAVALTIGALVLTLACFPVDYPSLGQPGYLTLRYLTARNLCLVGLLVVCWPWGRFGQRRRPAPATLNPIADPPLS